MRERTRLENSIDAIRRTQTELADAVEMIELAEAEEDANVLEEAEQQIIELHRQAGKKQLETMLSGEADANHCYLEIHAGAGGTESQDWAEMLLRMYSRWADQRGFKNQLIEASAGEDEGEGEAVHERGVVDGKSARAEARGSLCDE